MGLYCNRLRTRLAFFDTHQRFVFRVGIYSRSGAVCGPCLTDLKNKVQLITYVDRFGGGGLQGLNDLLGAELQGLFGCVHLLPFFDPIDGADTGFDPIDHRTVDSRLGDWDDIRSIARRTDVMADLIVNHMSAQSPEFRNFLEQGEKSDYADLFVSFDNVFPGGATSAELLSIYRPRPQLPFSVMSFRDGRKRLHWTTFTGQQMDIDVESKSGQRYLADVMLTLAEAGVSALRLDAAGYTIKRRGTNCFMLPETFEWIKTLRESAHELKMETLVELHAHYSTQIKLAACADWVYDFALPALVLHTLFSRNAQALKRWFAICPRNCINVLDTHDGIGVVDVAADSTDARKIGLITPAELGQLVETIHRNSEGVSRRTTGDRESNLDVYQVNCTYFDALGGNENDYLLARMIQFFAPGIPQVYYVGLLGGRNHVEQFLATGSGREINRGYYDLAKVRRELDKPMVKKLMGLIRLRNTHPAFSGALVLPDCQDHELSMRWKHQAHWAELQIDLNSRHFQLAFSCAGERKMLTDFPDLAQIDLKWRIGGMAQGQRQRSARSASRYEMPSK